MAFEALKRYMTEPPLLAKPSEGEKLYLYLAVSEQAISAVLVKRGRKNPETNLLRQQSIAWSRAETTPK